MKISINEVKNAMKDIKFRLTLPEELKSDVQKYEQNPSCPCNLPIYKKILQQARKQLQDYYPGKEIDIITDDLENNFSVINCHISELESKLRNLPPGRKQIAITRYLDQVTVIINEINFI